MPSENFLLDNFTVSARDIAEADVNSLLALSVGVGWPHRAEDWEFMRSVGHGRVAMDESGRVHGTAMWFPFGEACATIGMVITTPRLQTNGGGQWLTRHVLERTQGRALGLHATHQSHRLFLSLGFVDEGPVYRNEGHVVAPPGPASPTDAEIRAFAHSDLSAIREMDRTTTGWNRDTLIDALVMRSCGTVLVRNGRPEAFALMRPFGRGTVIGPVVAASEEDALSVLHPLIAGQTGKYVRIDTQDETSRFTSFARLCGLGLVEKVTRMSRGEPWPFTSANVPSQFAMASQATG
jgi:hypothetical protein